MFLVYWIMSAMFGIVASVDHSYLVFGSYAV